LIDQLNHVELLEADVRHLISFIAVPALLATQPARGEAPAVELPPEIAAHVPSNLRSYYIVFMLDPAQPKEMSQDLFVRHQAYIRARFSNNVFHIAGPLTDGGRIRGLTILSASSLDEARTIAAGDPAVQEKVLDFEVHPVILPDLSPVKAIYAPGTSSKGN
jgi:uncharacterized protein YciI